MRRKIAGCLLILCGLSMGALGVYGFIAVRPSLFALVFSSVLATGTLALGVWVISGRPAP